MVLEPPEPDSEESYPRWVVRLARLVLRIFFRRIEVVGDSAISHSGPTLFVANHNNSLVDPLLVIAFLPGRPRFLAKATLWRRPVLRPFLALGRVIPVFRRQDPGFDPDRNQATFDRCREVLADGGAIALFPEGRSHSDPALGELRTGTARIVAGAEDPRVRRARIVPVGLIFDEGHRFRSSVLVKVGEPLEVESLVSPGTASPREVRELTERIAGALEEVTQSYPSWDEARLLERAADIYLRPGPELPGEVTLADREPVIRAFLRGYRELREHRPQRLEPLARALSRYQRLLGAFGLSDAQVAASYPLGAVGEWTANTILRLGILLPLAAVGTLLSWVPYRLCGWLGSRVARNPDQPATHKIFGGLILFPVTWLLESALAWYLAGPLAALVLLALALAGSWSAIRFRDLWQLLRREGRAYLLLRTSGRLRSELRERRTEVRKNLLELVEELQ